MTADPDDKDGRAGPQGPDRRTVMKTALTAGLAGGLWQAGAQPAAGQGNPALPLEGQVALVTGAARGIGRAIALALARAGADIALLDLADPARYRDSLGYDLASAADLDEAVALVGETGRATSRLVADTTDPDAMQQAVAATLDRHGKLDIVVANAGVAAGAPLMDMPRDRWKTVIDINLHGTGHTLMATLPHMTARRAGRVIVVSSVSGRMGSPNSANYVASKWGLVGLVKAAAIDAGPHGVTVNAIAPTAVTTGIFGGLERDPGWRAGFETMLGQIHTLPVGMLEPEDIAGTAVFLASPAARYITGAVLDVAAGTNAHYTG